MNTLIDGKTSVYFCHNCGHLQTNELPDLADYYASEYEINLNSEDDDQLYKVIDGKTIYRADHQAAVLQSKVDLFPGCRVLDYGCAKAPTLRKVVATQPDIEPFLFDVTDKYVSFWNSYPKEVKYSVFQPDQSWKGSMDIVLSFYALEHVADLTEAINNVKFLLKPGGTFYFIVPNVYDNIADFIVADHINHFSKSSLTYFLSKEGFHDIVVDDKAHDAAFVVTAKLKSKSELLPVESNKQEIISCYNSCLEMADYWQEAINRIHEYEKNLSSTGLIAIYGAGFYGNLIASSLNKFNNVICFIDQNKFLQGTCINNRPVLSPEEMNTEVSSVFVGLNPRIAQETIDSIECWKNRHLNFFFL